MIQATPNQFVSLPAELHERILGFIIKPPTSNVLDDSALAEVLGEDTNQLLHPFLLLCRSLNARSAGLLYKSIDISSSRRMRLLRRTITLNPSLGKLVKRISLSFRHLPDPWHDAFSPSSVVRLFDHLVNLTSLSAEGTESTRLGIYCSIGDAKCFGPQFSELIIRPLSQEQPKDGTKHTSISDYFKYPVKDLSIDRFALHNVAHRIRPAWEPPAPVLKSLILTRSEVGFDGLEYLLKDSRMSLRTLVLDMHSDQLACSFDYVSDHVPRLIPIMETLSPELERLELYWTKKVEFPLSVVVSDFPNLRRLGWGGSLSDSVSSVLSDLPSKLEELVIERCPAVTPDHIVALINGGTSGIYPHGVQRPPYLREIEVGPDMGWTDAGWEDVRTACRREGVLVGFARTHGGLKPDPKVENGHRS